MTKVSWWVPALPPSSNQIYIRHPTGKGRILSSQARAFKIKAVKALQDGGKITVLSLEKNVPYELKLAIFFEQIANKHSGKGDRYRKIDTSNRVKLIEDAVSEAIGLDDRHNFRLIVEKHCDPNNPGIWVSLRRLSESEVGLTKEGYERLQGHEQDRADNDSPAKRLFGRCASWSESGGSHSDPGG